MRSGLYGRVRQITYTPPQAPGQVTGLSAGTPTTNSVPLSWAAATGSAPITYRVEVKRSDASAWTYWAQVSSTSYTVQSLQDNTTYQFRVRADNDAGSGAYSAVVTAKTQQAITSAQVAASNPSYWTQKTSNPAIVTKNGSTAYLSGEMNGANVATGTAARTVGTLPAGYRPSSNVTMQAFVYSNQNPSGTGVQISIATSGVITIESLNASFYNNCTLQFFDTNTFTVA
jgi:hypothetical protein